ncbi:MAG: SusC/RagA family TonB-linked outer membrane protein [Prevotella sp.]|nr:SusC/RagA family TonB-linked outer membrane protein [Prevotella sp.]
MNHLNKKYNSWSRRLRTAATVACLAALTAQAQNAGDIVSGTVTDEQGPIVAANVVEVDASNRIVAYSTTDINGNFSFKIVNPKDRIRVSFVGCKTKTLPIKGTTYNIELQSATSIGEVVVKAKQRSVGSGLAIPMDEISTAQQTINANEFQGLGITTIDEALQGRIAGLDIVANSGNLGAGTSMHLRGVSSVNMSSDPLIVVDGNVWQTDQNLDLSSANDEKFAELLNINPDDIESISVLKDAAATAIWGSQGANGVIEIKTKRGARGRTEVTYSYRLTGTYQPEGMKMLSGDQYTMLLKEEYFNPKLSDASSNIREINYDPSFSEYEQYNNNTDWVKAVKRTGWQQKHYLSVSGGGEKANFRIALGYDKETGSIIEQRLDRFTARVSLDYFVSNRIKISTNLLTTITKNKRNYQDLLAISYIRMPNLSIYEQDAEGHDTNNYYNMLPTVSGELQDQLRQYNPVALAHLAKNRARSYNIEPEFKINYELLGTGEGQTRLSYEGKIVFNIFNNYTDTFLPSSLVATGWTSSSANRTTYNSSKSLGITTTHTLTFVPSFRNKDHSLMMMARAQMVKGTSNAQSTGEYGLPTGTIQGSGAEGIINSFGTSSNEWRSIYFTFSAHYAYKGRYMADFSVRRDGSTRFGENQRWGNFPAFSVRWNVSREPWFKKGLPWVSMLSLRPGFGIVGNQPGGDFLYLSKYSNGNGYLGSGSVYPQNIQLKNLKWEEKTTYNLGIDYGFFNDIITGDFEVYQQNTKDLLMLNRGIPTSSGFTSFAYQNVGSMRNTGWEFNLNANRFIKAGKLSFDANITIANNKNRITSMDETVLKGLNSEFNHSNGSYLTRVEINKPFGGIYGFRYKGVYAYSEYSEQEVKGISGPNAPVVRDANGQVVLDERGRTKPMYFSYGASSQYEFKGGDAIYEDVNHDGNINELDIVYLGSSLPKLTGGFGFKVHYGNWTLNSQFNFRYGNKIINRARMLAENMYSNNNQSRAVDWRWRVEGDITEIPRALYQSGYNWLGSDRFIENGSFIRLNYAQLSYSMPSKMAMSLGLRRLSFYVSANNLFCLTKYSGADPEVGYGGYGLVYDSAQTPRSKSFTGGITIGF